MGGRLAAGLNQEPFGKPDIYAAAPHHDEKFQGGGQTYYCNNSDLKPGTNERDVLQAIDMDTGKPYGIQRNVTAVDGQDFGGNHFTK
jgi:hypothetical protein